MFSSVITLAAFALGLATGHPEQTFVLDESKPYVYIAFDHLAKRKPLSETESTKGLWLRLVNNCRVPISVHFFDPGTGDPGIGLYDDVLTLPAGISYQDSSGMPHGEPDSKKPPRGYSSDEIDVISLTTIDPGSSQLFSVPFDHVSQHWYLRIKFSLEPTKKASRPQPYSFADFSWTDLPEQYRSSRPEKDR
jgi:hypothetical protein